jgi:hypothetical protein
MSPPCHPLSTNQDSSSSEAAAAGQDTVAIGAIKGVPDEDLVELIKYAVERLGLPDFASISMIGQDSEAQNECCDQWGLQEKLGENLYAPITRSSSTATVAITSAPKGKDKGKGKAKGKGNGKGKAKAMAEEQDTRICVPLVVELRTGGTAFTDRLNAMAKVSRYSFDPTGRLGPSKTYILVPKVDEQRKGYREESEEESEDKGGEDGQEETAENFYVLWLPKQYHEHHKLISAHITYGEGESSRIKKRLKKGNTDTGNLKVSMFENHLARIKANNWGTPQENKDPEVR